MQRQLQAIARTAGYVVVVLLPMMMMMMVLALLLFISSLLQIRAFSQTVSTVL